MVRLIKPFMKPPAHCSTVTSTLPYAFLRVLIRSRPFTHLIISAVPVTPLSSVTLRL